MTVRAPIRPAPCCYPGPMPRRAHRPALHRPRRRRRLEVPPAAWAPAEPLAPLDEALPDLDDDEAWLVLGDQWQARGDARGVVVALAAAAEAAEGARRAALAAELRRVVGRCADDLVGPDLAPHLAEREGAVRLTWRRVLAVEATCTLGPPGRAPTPDAAAVALLAAAPAHRLRRLHLTATLPASLEPTAEATRGWPLPHLETLVLGDPMGDLRLGDVGRWIAVPTLRHLTLAGPGALSDGPLEHPDLQTLHLHTPVVWDRLARALSRADLPRLRHLHLEVTRPEIGAGVGWVAPLLARLPAGAEVTYGPALQPWVAAAR